MSRREIWSAIQKIKVNRVVILTTHSMEEAGKLLEHFVFIWQMYLETESVSWHMESSSKREKYFEERIWKPLIWWKNLVRHLPDHSHNWVSSKILANNNQKYFAICHTTWFLLPFLKLLFRCIGTSLHLKNKFGLGYRLNLSTLESRQAELQALVDQKLPGKLLGKFQSL